LRTLMGRLRDSFRKKGVFNGELKGPSAHRSLIKKRESQKTTKGGTIGEKKS